MNVRIVHILAVWLVCLALWAGCVQRPTPSSTFPHLTSRVEQQLVQEARHLRSQGQVQESVRLLERFVVNHPRSLLLDEVHWELAQSSQQAGDYRKALDYYRIVATTVQEHTDRDRAKLHVLELEKMFVALPPQPRPVRGLFVSASTLQETGVVTRLLEEAAGAQITTYILEMGCTPYRWKDFMRVGGNRLIAQAHQHQQTVMAAVSLRCIGMPHMGDDWRDRSYDPVSTQMRPSQFFDLFHAGYQQHLVALLGALAQTGIDGFVFRADAPLGPFDGLTPLAIRAFDPAFDVHLEPQEFLTFPHSSKAGFLYSDPLTFVSDHEVFSPLFWQWSGWKMREQVRVMTKLSEQLSDRFPSLEFGVEIHALSLQHPLPALVAYAEDWAEIGKSQFDFVLIQQQAPNVPKNLQGFHHSAPSNNDAAPLRPVPD